MVIYDSSTANMPMQHLERQHRLEERRILVRVEEKQRVVARDVLLVVDGVDRNPHRVLQADGHAGERRVAVELHADVLVPRAIDLERAQEARREAERALESRYVEGADLSAARAQLQSALLRIRVAERRRREGPRSRG